jgi:hypothetical protein
VQLHRHVQRFIDADLFLLILRFCHATPPFMPSVAREVNTGDRATQPNLFFGLRRAARRHHLYTRLLIASCNRGPSAMIRLTDECEDSITARALQILHRPSVGA